MKRLQKLFTMTALFLLGSSLSMAQVAVNNSGAAPHASAMLDVSSTSLGLLVPRMTTASRLALAATAAEGLIVFDTDLDRFFYFNGTVWEIGAVGDIWSRTGTITYATNTGDYFGMGLTNPARKFEFRGTSYQTARISATDAGAGLELVSTTQPDWALYTWNGALWLSKSANDFVSKTDEYIITDTYFSANDNGGVNLGRSSYRWGNYYGVNADFSGSVGIGTASPARKLEVVGGYQTMRLTTTSSGPYLEFSGSSTTDYAIGQWGNSVRILSSTDDFVNITDEYTFSTTVFRAFTASTKDLGSSGARWVNTYSNNINIDGYIDGTPSSVGGLNVHDPTNELAKLYVTPITTGSEDSAMLFLAEDHDGTFGMYWLYDGVGNDMELWGRSGTTNYGPHIMVDRTNGNMAIGGEGMATGYKLNIHGDVICEELRVELVANWPDYVFDQEYDLMTLPELEKFIKKHGHLPDVPSAGQVEEQGFEVGEMQKVMLKKIEELSLYIIRQQEEIDALKIELEKIRK